MSNYKILSYYKRIVTKEKYGFLKLRTREKWNNIIITEKDSEFNFIILNATYNWYDNYYIHSILRLNDNKVLTIGDDTDVFNGSKNYIEKIGSFHLDGESYLGMTLTSKSGIQAFFGGGCFVDIEDFNKTPLKELRKEKLKKLTNE